MFPGWREGEKRTRRNMSHDPIGQHLRKSCLRGAELTSAFIPFIEYPQGLNIVASITEPGIRSQIPLNWERKRRMLTADEIWNCQRKPKGFSSIFNEKWWQIAAVKALPHSSTSIHLISHVTAVNRQDQKEEQRGGVWQSWAGQLESYMSDITCRNTIFHIELVHNCWIKVTHQNFQCLICMLVFPVLWQVQGKQVPEMGRDSWLSQRPTYTQPDCFENCNLAKQFQYLLKLPVSSSDTYQQSEFKRPIQ